MEINLSPTRENYYSQLNNERDPYNACQCTSMVAGLDAGKFGLEPVMAASLYRQPEDKLRDYMLRDPDVQNYWKKNFDTAIPAPEWAGCMEYAVNRLYGRRIVYYQGKIFMQDIIDDLKNGLPVYLSMAYPDNRDFSGKPAPVPGHIVLAVGVVDENIIINDPYKNHLTGGRDGWNNAYSPLDFQRHARGHGIRYRKA